MKFIKKIIPACFLSHFSFKDLQDACGDSLNAAQGDIYSKEEGIWETRDVDWELDEKNNKDKKI